MGLPRCVLGLLSAPSVLPARACVVRGGNKQRLCSEPTFQLPRTLGGVVGLVLWVPAEASALYETRKGAAAKFLVCLWGQIELGGRGEQNSTVLGRFGRRVLKNLCGGLPQPLQNDQCCAISCAHKLVLDTEEAGP